MSNNFFQRARDALFVFPWWRFLYPLGALAIGVILLLSFIATKRFFTTTIGALTAVPISRASDTDTFHLAAYRSVAPAFGLLPKSAPVLLSVDKAAVTVVVRNAQGKNDRVALLTKIVEGDGWKISISTDKEDSEIRFAVATTVVAKEKYRDAAELLAALLARKGFVVRLGEPLSDTDTHQVLITLGGY